MNKTTMVLILIAWASTLGFGQLTTAEKKEGWRPLFNGKDFDGWNQKNGKAKYEIKNGEIVGITTANTPNSFMCTNESYGDFILELELKVDDRMNSGVQFRSLSSVDYMDGRVHGYQMEIDPSERAWAGGIYDEGRRGWLAMPEGRPEAQNAFRHNDWNTYRIEAIGNTIRTWVNGVPVTHLVDDMTPSGFIALQVHSIYGEMKEGMEIRWRNIKIKTEGLKPSPYDDCPVVNLLENQLSAQEKSQGFELLFNGKDFSGWRGVNQEGMAEKHWVVTDNNEIHVQASDGSETGNDIVTKEEFSAFELKFDFKLTEGANSGLKYFVDESYDRSGKSGIGLEYQILDDEHHPDAKMGVVGNRTLASLYDLIPSIELDGRFKKKIGEWNHGRLVVYPDNTVQHWLNGFKVVEYKRKSNIFKALVARSKYQKFEHFGEADSGPILLQDHGDNAYFKNIKIRTLN